MKLELALKRLVSNCAGSLPRPRTENTVASENWLREPAPSKAPLHSSENGAYLSGVCCSGTPGWVTISAKSFTSSPGVDVGVRGTDARWWGFERRSGKVVG